MDPVLEQRIRRAYAGFAAGDVDTALADYAPDARLVNPEYAVDGGIRTGLHALRASMEGLLEQFELEELEIEQLVEGPRGVLVVSRWGGSGPTSGAPIDEPLAHDFELRDRRVATPPRFRTLEEGREAAGLPYVPG